MEKDLRGVSVAISIATYKRPELLAGLLRSLDDLETSTDISIIVVDNDAESSAQSVVGEFGAVSRSPVTYSVEPEPGITSARNAGLAVVKSWRRNVDYVAFIDDDEKADVNWLDQLVAAAERYDATLVSGPVRYEYQDEVDPWLVDGGYFISPVMNTGDVMPFAATNNLLIKWSALETLGPNFFDSRFGITGGSDIMLTRSLVSAGHRLIWCDSAVVSESVPPARMTRSWAKKRARRTGNTHARVLIYSSAGPRLVIRSKVFVMGLTRILLGGVGMTFAQAFGRRYYHARLTRTYYRGVGITESLVDRNVHEYAR